MSPSVNAFPFEAGKSVKITAERVNAFVSKLNEAGYACALHARDFTAGKFTVTVDAAHGYTVSWLKLGGLREVAA